MDQPTGMSKHIKDRADFGKIRYANCWEDADILCQALQPAEGKRFLSIASAGDNSFSLIASGAAVVACDLSLAQLAIVELRRESFRRLSYEPMLGFLGVTPCQERTEIYEDIKSGLSDMAKDFWDGHRDAIASGFIHAGKFEDYFKRFRTRIIPLIHSRSKVAELLEIKSLEAQHEFYTRRWNTFRWRMLFRVFFSRFVMGRLGRDPEFFRYVEGSVAERILARTKHALTEISTANNPYLRYILTGNYSAGSAGQNGLEAPIALPHYLRKENFEAIRAGLDRLTLYHGSVQEAADQSRDDGFDGFNLSDIFEYLDSELCEQIYGELLTVARPGARFAYWNMLVPRQVPDSLANNVTRLDELAGKLFQQDQAWFYSAFVVEEKA
jgi:S-adenosylmethionine-diacylglycerol 3-amino-3-carboxypropyl transferase